MDSQTPQQKNVRADVRERTAGYIGTAFGLVAGLAWNDAVKAFIDYFYPVGGGNGIAAKFVYAIIITIIVVIITRYMTHWASLEETK